MRAEKKSYLPWIIGGAIGGGVLVLGGIVLAVVVVLNWGADQAEKLVADAKGAASKTATKAAAASVQAQSNPEANPESNPEATLAEPAAALKPAEPMPVPEPVKPAEPMPAVVQPLAAEPPEPAKPAEPMPEPVKPEPVEPVKPAEPLPAEPLPAEPPPAPPKAANPFQGFASSVSLPKLPVGTAEPSPETLAPLVLGPCAVDEKVLVILQLNGGGSAIRGGKQKFELKESEGGISLRDWEIVLTSGAKPLVVARLSAQNDQLTFAWSPEGAREPAAPLLCNCGLTMTAGSGRHDLALRQPVVAAPLTVELEKSGGAKWQIDLLPDPKSVFVEVAKLEGGFLKHKFDKPQMELSDTNAIWTGNDEDSLILGLKLTTTASARGIELKTAPQVKFEIGARPQVLIKKTLSIAEKQVKQEQAILTTRLQTLPAQQNERVEQQKNLLNAELEKVNERSGQLTQLAELIASLQGKGLVHFRVYHQTEDGQIDLLVTDSPPAVENKDEPPKEENEKK